MKRYPVADFLVVTAAVGCAVILMSYADVNTASVNSSSNIDSGNSIFFPPDTKPYNITYNEWAAEAWKWFVEIPEKDTPAGDMTGEKCSINQDNPKVWFLAGTFVGAAKRTCEIPAGKAIAILADGINAILLKTDLSHN